MFLQRSFPLQIKLWIQILWSIMCCILGYLKLSDTMVLGTYRYWYFWQCGMAQSPARKENQHFYMILVSKRKHEVLKNLLEDSCTDLGPDKTQCINTST